VEAELSGVTGEYDEMKLIREAVGELLAHVRLLRPETRISSLSLFRMADAATTVRGSIGYEMPCFGVPVALAARGVTTASASRSITTTPKVISRPWRGSTPSPDFLPRRSIAPRCMLMPCWSAGNGRSRAFALRLVLM
jgi:hypothetical protein